MKISVKKVTWMTAGTCFALLAGAPAIADDTELLLINPDPTQNPKPNVMFILDTSGSITMARAMAMRCCWPPESWLGIRFSTPGRRTISSARVTFLLTSSFDTSLYFKPKATFSKMVLWGNRA